ncbi:hypothetical protein BMT_08945 [Priestia megaterium NBRC 15308 = ATCC 14581]|nr:hypothetical protein BMT_08945 [Priestia megaterium NBRC 15308 = ATCC 14581]PAK46833.1 hypothetical protein CHH47_22170 [Priestia megaterium]
MCLSLKKPNKIINYIQKKTPVLCFIEKEDVFYKTILFLIERANDRHKKKKRIDIKRVSVVKFKKNVYHCNCW